MGKERGGSGKKKGKKAQRPQWPLVEEVEDPAALATREYLNRTIIPVLMRGLHALARERPADPIDFLSSYLLNHQDIEAEKRKHDDDEDN